MLFSDSWKAERIFTLLRSAQVPFHRVSICEEDGVTSLIENEDGSLHLSTSNRCAVKAVTNTVFLYSYKHKVSVESAYNEVLGKASIFVGRNLDGTIGFIFETGLEAYNEVKTNSRLNPYLEELQESGVKLFTSELARDTEGHYICKAGNKGYESTGWFSRRITEMLLMSESVGAHRVSLISFITDYWSSAEGVVNR